MFDPYATGENKIQVFQCANCREFINTTMTSCKFCHAPVDAAAAQKLVTLQGQVNWACNEANLVRWLATALPITFVVGFLPLLGGVGYRAFRLLLLGLLVAIIHWQFAYAKLQTNDADFPVAEKRILTSTIIWGVMFAGWIVLLIVKLWRGNSILGDLLLR